MESDKITPEIFAPAGLTHRIRIASLGIDIPTQRSPITLAEAWRDRVRGTSFEVPFHFISSIALIANQPAIGRASDVEQWKHIPGKTESGTQAFL